MDASQRSRGPLDRAWLVRLALLAAFVAAAAHRISRPGPLYDEVLFVNAALGGAGDSFVQTTLWGVPVMLMDYVGALKAWLHAPVFALLGVSPETLRLPSVLLVAATILVLALLAERAFGRRAGLLLALVLATDPGFLTTARVDYGPVVLAGLLKALLLWATLAWLEAPSPHLVWALLALAALGVFDKLNFVWFLLALGSALLLVYPRELWRALRGGGRWGLLPVAAGALGLAVLGSDVVLPLLRGPGPGGDVVRAPLGARFATMLALTRQTLAGDTWWQLVFRVAPPARPEWMALEGTVAVLALSTIGMCVFARRLPTDALRLARLAAFFALLSVLVFAQLVLTPHANGPHHVAMLHPFPVFALFAGGLALLACAPEALRRPGSVAAILAVLLFVAGQVRFDAAYLRQLRERGTLQAWGSTAIYGLSADLQRLAPDLVASADWGMHNQLYALAPPGQRPRYRNLYGVMQESADDAAATGALAEPLRDGKRVAVVLHPAEQTYMPRARQRFLAFARSRPRGTVDAWTVRDASGAPVYEVYFLVPQPPA